MSLKKAKLKSKTLLSRLGGVSAFGFGVSLKLPEETAPSCGSCWCSSKTDALYSPPRYGSSRNTSCSRFSI